MGEERTLGTDRLPFVLRCTRTPLAIVWARTRMDASYLAILHGLTGGVVTLEPGTQADVEAARSVRAPEIGGLPWLVAPPAPEPVSVPVPEPAPEPPRTRLGHGKRTRQRVGSAARLRYWRSRRSA